MLHSAAKLACVPATVWLDKYALPFIQSVFKLALVPRAIALLHHALSAPPVHVEVALENALICKLLLSASLLHPVAPVSFVNIATSHGKLPKAFPKIVLPIPFVNLSTRNDFLTRSMALPFEEIALIRCPCDKF